MVWPNSGELEIYRNPGFSNGHIDDKKWNKVETGKRRIKKLISNLKEGEMVSLMVSKPSIIGQDLPWDEIFSSILGNTCEVPEGSELPDTGVAEWRERRFSAMKILPFWNFAAPVIDYSTFDG